MEALLAFDAELFVAFAVDWQERVVVHGEIGYLKINFCDAMMSDLSIY